MRSREWLRRVWGALSGRRSDRDLERELAAHLAFAEDDLLRQGVAPAEAARRARAAAGGSVQALEALRDQRGLPWLTSSWLDIKLGLRLLARNWGLTLVGGLAMTLAIAIAAVVFAAVDLIAWGTLPLDEGERVVAIQVWDREAGRRRDTTAPDVERWREALRSIEDVAVFQAIQRNVIAPDRSVELATVAAMSPAGFRVARVSPVVGRVIVDADAASNAAPVIVIGHDVWQRRFAGAHDVIGRELRLGTDAHTVVGVMPRGFAFPLNFHYWIPLRPAGASIVRNTGPEGVVFGRLSPGATLERAHAEVSALGLVPASGGDIDRATIAPRVVPYTFAFTGDFERGELGLLWSMSSLLLVLLLLPPCANIAILNYARTVTRQQEFAARHALGGSRARIVWQLFVEALVLTAASAVAALVVVRVIAVVVEGRLQQIPGGAPFWMTFGISYRTVIFVGVLSLAGAAIAGLIPALQATGRLARLGAGALAGRAGVKLGATWTTLVIAQVAFSVGVLPLAAQLTWGTMRAGVVGPGFAAEEYATARIALEAAAIGSGTDAAVRFGNRQRELMRTLQADPAIAGVASSLQPPGEEPWVFADIEGRETPSDVLNGTLPGYSIRFNEVDTAFFDLYEVPVLAGRRFEEGDASADAGAVVVNRNFAETITPGGNALGHRFRYVKSNDGESPQRPAVDRWYEVVGVVGNLPASTDARVAYHATAPGQMQRVHVQVRLRGDRSDIAERLRHAALGVDPSLQLDEIRTLAEIYREHRFGDNIGAITIASITGSLLLLSAAGLYALMSFTVAQRRREIGIRSALGAPPGRLMAAVFRRAFWQIGAGLVLGLLASHLAGRYLPIEQIGGLPIPGILPAAAALMLIVGVVSAMGPARRGLRVDPTEALRSE